MIGFFAGNLESQTQALANLLPNGRLFEAKNISDSKFRKLLMGFAYELWRFDSNIQNVALQHYIPDTVDFISEWEKSFGIPDSCFGNKLPLQQRINNILTKIKARGLSTKQDYINLAAFMGYTITIDALGGSSVPPPYPVPFYITSSPQARFVWIIKGADVAPFVPPYPVPFTVNSGSSVMQCFFNKLKPANTILYFINT